MKGSVGYELGVGHGCGYEGKTCGTQTTGNSESAGSFHEGLVRGHQAKSEDRTGDVWRLWWRLPPPKVILCATLSPNPAKEGPVLASDAKCLQS